MNRLAALLDSDDVEVDVGAASTVALFARAALVLGRRLGQAGAGGTGDAANVAATLLERERLGSTCLGHGVAIPHGRHKGLRRALAAVLRLKAPLRFGGPDDEPAILFVFLLVPELATQADLEVLGEIAEMLCDRDVRERLKRERDAPAVFATIAGWTPRQHAISK